RSIVNVDAIFNEDTLSKYGEAFMIEMYLENIDGFEGEGDLLTKFGVEVRDSMTLVLSRRRWEQLTGRFLQQSSNRPTISRPQEGDLIYFPMIKHMLQISFVEEESPFYQLSNLPTFKLICETFEYNNEEINTGLDIIDKVELEHAQSTRLTFGAGVGVGDRFVVGEKVTQFHNLTVDDITYSVIIHGDISKVADDMSYVDVVGIYAEGDGYDITTIDFDPGTLTFKPAPLSALWLKNKDQSVTRRITGVESFENLSINDSLADNSELESFANNFIDFTESNPFGEINITN
ncbi:MAG: hypothetical protein ACO3UU_15630, partial [Minisyncoccia bacterium]